MYTLLRIMQSLACIIVFMAIILIWVNAWQKKYDKENANYSKEYKKMVKTFFWISLATFLVTSLILELRMY